MAKVERSLGEKLQGIPKPVLYLLLLLCTSVPLFMPIPIPNKASDESIDLYAAIMSIEPGKTVVIASDWTNGTRGESGGQFEALIKLLMRENIKFAIYSSGDPQAPQVAKDAIGRLNDERVKKGEKPYEIWSDWIPLGYLPNAEAAGQAIANNFRSAFNGRKEAPPGSTQKRDVFESPVLQNVRTLQDVPLLVIATASKTSTISIERFYGKVPIGLMVTGVMGPESLNYYASGQVVGMLNGLKGLYDTETMMEVGVNWPEGKGTVDGGDKYKGKTFKGFPGMVNQGNGTRYYPALHFALGLLILAVIVGNVGMFMTRRAKR